ncbi:Uncharacterised protein [Nocardia cyriacigeorgica]|uniref:Uncharacterized protein n=1 Tax=Nocardia cyriacigeorgica TaxID=135487 RepID=A0A4U8VSJ1_9NOCA|nr:hypothetical protein FMUAM8_17060 [Nocardia cyriacigeorgica]VFA96401.1 Uncharacterised protein [Nocardia cyriacigeorgica]
MCSPARCPACGKTTWSGCGARIEALRARSSPITGAGQRVAEARAASVTKMVAFTGLLCEAEPSRPFRDSVTI